MLDDDIRTVVLPQSLLHLQWRESDRHWRLQTEEDASIVEPDVVAAFEQDWSPWSAGTNGAVYGHMQPNAYEFSTAWWVLYGECPAADSGLAVQLADGTEPRVYELGRVWAAEWISPPQEATAHYPDGPRTMQFQRPGLMVPGTRYK